jgi:hypothetical protein
MKPPFPSPLTVRAKHFPGDTAPLNYVPSARSLPGLPLAAEMARENAFLPSATHGT